MRWAYVLYAVFVVAGYAAAAHWGVELGSNEKGVVPANVRQAGYRSYSFWRGGK
jgi:hypothetical protein